MTLLLVEDEEIVRNPLVRILRNAGYDVLQASSGPEALEIVAARPELPALIIADVRLQGMSGIELLQRLRADGVAAPVLLVSGMAQPGNDPLPGGDGAGPVRFLLKPFSGPELTRAIEALIAQTGSTT